MSKELFEQELEEKQLEQAPLIQRVSMALPRQIRTKLDAVINVHSAANASADTTIAL